ncbi:hypothetical protein GDO81_004268 [Engystomops pustulosus]|uniref:Uncharacterized protein n=1 Tax=Engystomops pustulosus TaxID=76066 RepID=A0AAV7A0E8_ENGPU|nr:hypothetical protein GDO81_004268 [Engystomops pustulosus]
MNVISTEFGNFKYTKLQEHDQGQSRSEGFNVKVKS